MPRFKPCPNCGAGLDPQESCKCTPMTKAKKVTFAPLKLKCFTCPSHCEGGGCVPPPDGFFDKLINALKKD